MKKNNVNYSACLFIVISSLFVFSLACEIINAECGGSASDCDGTIKCSHTFFVKNKDGIYVCKPYASQTQGQCKTTLEECDTCFCLPENAATEGSPCRCTAVVKKQNGLRTVCMFNVNRVPDVMPKHMEVSGSCRP